MKTLQTMKAVVSEKYGSPDTMRYTDCKRPVPKKNQVLIEMRASGVNAYDWHKQVADTFMIRVACGIFKPKNPILGCDIAGVVVEVGSDCKKFRVGDEVVGCTADGLGDGGYAEFVCAPERTLALKPKTASFEEAATFPMAGVTALQGIRLADIRTGQTVLINGASGGVGTFALQMAKAKGAIITAVCSERNAGLVRGIGADFVIDYKKENFWESGKQYDRILDITASATKKQLRAALNENGVLVVIGFKNISLRYSLSFMFGGKPKPKNGNKRVSMLMAKNTDGSDLDEIGALFESGKIKPVIDCVYPLSETPTALMHYEKHGAKGKIVIGVKE